MFNKKASNPKNKPDQILETLALRQGQKVADIGAGGGYFSLRFANAVGREGQVFAVDTNEEFLEYIKYKAKEEGLNNVETVLVTEDDLTLPKGSIDLIFMRNVYHHLTNRVQYFKRIKGLMKPEGRIAIIEYRHGRRFSFRGIFGHYVPKEIIIKEMNEAGYQLEEDMDFLPEQSFTIFSCQK
jgi:ubiquinone/menaquinone biosynthesis C-methylase UbiE